MQEVYFSSNILGTYRIVFEKKNISRFNQCTQLNQLIIDCTDYVIAMNCTFISDGGGGDGGSDVCSAEKIRIVRTIYNSFYAIAFGLNRGIGSSWAIFDWKTSDEFVAWNFDYFSKNKFQLIFISWNSFILSLFVGSFLKHSIFRSKFGIFQSNERCKNGITWAWDTFLFQKSANFN